MLLFPSDDRRKVCIDRLIDTALRWSMRAADGECSIVRERGALRSSGSISNIPPASYGETYDVEAAAIVKGP